MDFTLFSYANEGLTFFNFIYKYISVKLIIFVIFSLACFVCLLILTKNILNLNWKKRLILLLIVFFVGMGFRKQGLKEMGTYEINTFDQVLFPRYYYDNFINSNRSLCVSGLYEYTFRDLYLNVKQIYDLDYTINDVNNLMSKDRVLEKNKYTGIAKDKNVIMIMLESIDNVVVTKETMPTLYSLKNKGLNFTNRYAQFVNSGSTLSTEFTSLTGLFDNGSFYYRNKGEYNNSLPNVLKNNGYKTLSVHENTGSYYNRILLHKKIGFDNSYFIRDRENKYTGFDDRRIISDEDVYNFAFPKEDKFMTFIITISAHGPYVDNYMCSEDDEAKNDSKKCLQYGAKRTDEMLSMLLDKLKEDGLLDDSLLVLYTDHFAYSYDYQAEDYAIYKQIDDGFNIKNIPFIIYSTDIKHKVIDDVLVSDIDIVPTLLNMLGIEYDPNEYLGSDVFASYHNNLIIFNDSSWYDGNIYSNNSYVDKSSEYYLQTSKYVDDLLKLNEMIINTNYYKDK